MEIIHNFGDLGAFVEEELLRSFEILFAALGRACRGEGRWDRGGDWCWRGRWYLLEKLLIGVDAIKIETSSEEQTEGSETDLPPMS